MMKKSDRERLVEMAAQLKRHRQCLRWTLKDAERFSGVSDSVISDIERGRTLNPGILSVVLLARAYGCSVDRIIE